MRISKIVQPSGVVFPSVIAKMLLSKEVIEHIIDKFKNKVKNDWESRPPKDIKCKKSETLRVITEKNDDVPRKCIKVENWIDIDGIEGPFLMKNNIVFYNRQEKLLLAIMCPSFMRIPANINDVWVRKVIPFTYGEIDFEVPSIVGTIDMEKFFDKAVFTTVFGNEKEYDIKLHRVYGTFQWEIEQVFADNYGYYNSDENFNKNNPVKTSSIK